MHTDTTTLKIRMSGDTTNFALGLEIIEQDGNAYFDENDGTRLACLTDAFSDLGDELTIESDKKSNAWLSTWDSDSLEKLNGKTIVVKYTEYYTIDEDGDREFEKSTAERVSLS
jgi:hypothetical protein